MSLQLVVLSISLAFPSASTEQCVSSRGSSIDLSLHSRKNASGHWITKVDTRRFIMKENPREFTVDVHQETRLCDSDEIEQLVSVAFIHTSLQDTSMLGANHPSTTTTATTPSTTTSTTSTTRPKSCPHSGYQLFPEFNCYKVFHSSDEKKTWSDAREQCRRDGGDLMVIETGRERKDVYIPLHNSLSWTHYPWVGVYIPQGGDGWMTVKGEPALSTWWGPGEPEKNDAYKCAYAPPTGLLRSLDCARRQTFICEVPLSTAS